MRILVRGQLVLASRSMILQISGTVSSTTMTSDSAPSVEDRFRWNLENVQIKMLQCGICVQ